MSPDHRSAGRADPAAGSPPPPPITSLTNPRVKAAVRLRDRRERDETGLTILDGAREIRRALDAGVRVETAFVAPDLLRTPDAFAVEERLRHRPTTIGVTPAVLAKVAFGERSDGIVAIVETPRMGLADLALPDDALVVVVEGVEKPGNLGAVLRTADAAGAHAVIAADPRTDLFNPNAIRASIGTIFGLPVVAATSAETLAWLAEQGIRPVAALVDAPTDYTAADLSGPVAIVLGSEADGLTSAWRDSAVLPVSIPMRGRADSLNVSIAAAVLLFEAVRQRRAGPDAAD
ncbi:MAG TPA: TrmH family RNA methyltransferase [Candidatus Limnocylindrales bacterium]|nr:TrmH family RNA methyltransferase [Candidatus Limnocylindrales bacterium]